MWSAVSVWTGIRNKDRQAEHQLKLNGSHGSFSLMEDAASVYGWLQALFSVQVALDKFGQERQGRKMRHVCHGLLLEELINGAGRVGIPYSE